MKFWVKLLTYSVLGSIAFGQKMDLSEQVEIDNIPTVRSVTDLITVHETMVQQLIPIAPPSGDLFTQLNKKAFPFNFKSLPDALLKSMVAKMDDSAGVPIPVYSIFVGMDEKDVLFFVEGGCKWAVYRLPLDYNPILFRNQVLGVADLKELDRGNLDFLERIYNPYRFFTEIKLVPEIFYADYQEGLAIARAKDVPSMRVTESIAGGMNVSFQAVSVEDDEAAEEEVPMMAMAAFPPSLGGTTTNTSGSSSGSSNQLMQLTFTPPAGFGNYAEIFRTTSLIPTNWSVVLNAQAVTSGVEATWIDYASSNQASGFYIISDATDDPDGDGFSSLRESYIARTSYTNFNFYDSDNDGLHDWFETIYFGSITNQTGTNDFDADGLMNNQEWVLNSNSVTWISDPMLYDTDGDGASDYTEVMQGSDPSDPSDNGQAPTNVTTTVTLFVQDRSPDLLQGGYTMTLVSGTNSYSVASTGSNAASNTVNVIAGQTYTLTLIANDFDPYSGAYTATVSGENLVIVDPEGILGVHNDNNTTNNLSSPGKTATVHVVKKDYVFIGFGDGSSLNSQSQLLAYLNSIGATINNDNVWVYAPSNSAHHVEVKFVDDVGFVEALSKKDAYVAFDGHSNYGIGFAWNNTCSDVNDFLNVGDSYTGVHWESLHEQQSNLAFPEIAQNPENYVTRSSFIRLANEPGVYNNMTIPKVGYLPPNNVFTNVYGSGTNSFHYYSKPNNQEPWVILKSGSSDLPTLRYKWLLIDTCNSALYYSNSFSCGKTILTITPVYSESNSMKLFVQAIIEKSSLSDLKDNLEQIDVSNDNYAVY